MAKRTLIIYDYDSYDIEIRHEMFKINKYLKELLYVKKHYYNSMRFMRLVAEKYNELGIKSDIYYKISNTQNIIDNKNLSTSREIFNCQTFDIYMQCMNRRDYRNAMKMLKLYQDNSLNNSDFIKIHSALVHTKIAQFDEAQSLLDEASISQQENPLYYTVLLEILYKRKEYEKVVELFPLVEKYDGYTNYKLYVTFGKAYLQLGKEQEANQMFDIVRKIVKDDTFANKVLRQIKKVAQEDFTREYPSRRDLYISYQIALDDKNYALAMRYLEKVIEQPTDGKYINQNRKKLKELKRMCK